jgi:hypothetical protein
MSLGTASHQNNSADLCFAARSSLASHNLRTTHKTKNKQQQRNNNDNTMTMMFLFASSILLMTSVVVVNAQTTGNPICEVW